MSSELTEWAERDGGLERTLHFDDFRNAFAFMIRVAVVAEELDHHPDWRNVYGTVEIRLTTHSAGSTVTDQDREMAAAIDRLVDE